uniref:TSA: Wollemia nobilis Ref_Wollemi_Transcript_6820_1247 transcribed RNA sequence n=1 Tax=Wollemia nobilis TaxID=56998 RepID=A0A0C9RP33_9CONI
MLSGGYTRSDTAPLNNGSANGPIAPPPAGVVAAGFQPPRVGVASMANNNPGVVRPGWGTMPLHMAPYATQPMPVPPPNGMQGQLVCNGCRTLLVYPQGATNVCCAVCNTVTAVPPPGTEMAQLICGGCRTLLMYVRGATSVQCSCCHTVNLAMEANQVAHVNCGHCCTTLMYPYGAPSVKCALCHFVTAVGMNNMRMPLPAQRPPTASATPPSSSSALPDRSQTQTVVVENPMTVDESGKLVSNVAVGVTTEKS